MLVPEGAKLQLELEQELLRTLRKEMVSLRKAIVLRTLLHKGLVSFPGQARVESPSKEESSLAPLLLAALLPSAASLAAVSFSTMVVPPALAGEPQ